MWAWFFKTTRERDEEARKPRAFKDTLQEKEASRFADTVLLVLSVFAGLGDFVQMLGHHHGTPGRLPVSDRVRSSGFTTADVLRAHIVTISADPDQFRDFLDYLAQACFFGSREARRYLELDVEGQIGLINKALQHEAVDFRIVPDAQHGYAVHRLGSQAMRANAIEPALALLREHSFPEALGHYEKALRAFAHGDATEAVRESSHALEAVMKDILERKGTPMPKAPAKALIDALVNTIKLLPSEYQTMANGLTNVLQSVPTTRNVQPGAGHGSPPGATPADLEIAEFAVNQAGASILFLIRRFLST